MTQRPLRIAIGVDGSAPAHRALEWAVVEAVKWGAHLTVVHAWRFGSSPTDPLVPQDAIRRVGAAAQHLLDEEVAFARDRGADATGSLVFETPMRALTNASVDADLLVVGSRGRGAVTGALLGSVSQACVRHARCPVVVVPDGGAVASSPEERDAVPAEGQRVGVA
jgi:nucleotide-binding universal stress UspA family protein